MVVQPKLVSCIIAGCISIASLSAMADDEVSKLAASVYRVEKESTQSLILELTGDRTTDERLFLILPRPQFDLRFGGPKFVYSEIDQTGQLQFKVQWPTGLGATGDRAGLKTAYEAIGTVKSLNSVDHLSTAQLLIHLDSQVTHLQLKNLLSNDQLNVKASPKEGLDPTVLRAGGPLDVLFLFDITVDDVRIPIAYKAKLPVSPRILTQ